MAKAGVGCKHQERSASPMPSESSPKEKRVWTNNHPGLIGKKGHHTKAEVAAEKAAKEAKETTATATEEMVLTELAEIEKRWKQ